MSKNEVVEKIKALRMPVTSFENLTFRFQNIADILEHLSDEIENIQDCMEELDND